MWVMVVMMILLLLLLGLMMACSCVGIPATAEKIIALTTAAAVREMTTIAMTIYSTAVGINTTVEALDRAG